MLNRDGITKSTYGAPTQILANVDFQCSVGCIVSADLGVQVGGRKIVKAGTPIHISTLSLQTPATADDANAVLLHEVDVTNGNANGTALIIGMVNLNRVDSDVATKIINATSGFMGIIPVRM